MARKIKFPLKMKDGYDARSIEELREHFNLESVLGYFADGRLQTWLRDRYLDDEAQQVSELDSNDSELVAKICSILGVEAPVQVVNVDVHEINRYNEKRKLLLEKYPDSELLNNIDAVAFNDDDIIQIIEKGIKEIYLIDNEFEFPFEINDGKIVKKDGSPLPLDIGVILYDCKFIGKEAKLHIDSNAIRICNVFRLEFENINFIFADEDVEFCFKRKILNDVDAVLSIASSCYEAKDYNAAYENYLIAAQLGNPIAQYNLGVMCNQGEGVEKDYTKAVEWYQKAAKQGIYKAMIELGNIYRIGRGTVKDQKKATEWYEKSIEYGQIDALDAICKLGKELEYGYGIECDYIEAARLYKLAAKYGHADSQFELGCMYSVGDGVEQDNKKMIELLTQAAEQGHAEAQYLLGDAYSIGVQVKKDDVKAVEWYRKAAEQGHVDAQSELKIINREGSKIDIIIGEKNNIQSKSAICREINDLLSLKIEECPNTISLDDLLEDP